MDTRSTTPMKVSSPAGRTWLAAIASAAIPPKPKLD
jgi:hypothetical protein